MGVSLPPLRGIIRPEKFSAPCFMKFWPHYKKRPPTKNGRPLLRQFNYISCRLSHLKGSKRLTSTNTGKHASQILFKLCLVFNHIVSYIKNGEIMKKIDLMIFDFDGTLVSTGMDLANAVNYTLKSIGLNERAEKEIINFVGDGVNKLIQRALGQSNMHRHEEAITIFSRYYGEHLFDNTVLCPSVEDVLKKFSEKPKVILTNKRINFTISIAEKLKIDRDFVEIIGEGSTPYIKPDRELVDVLIDKYSAARDKTVIIGDGINDIILARNSEILCCVLLNGLGKREELLAEKADYYCEDILEINSLFC
jgi:phosphoglycolate phosphatase